MLTPLQRHERVEACEELLARYEEEENDFLSRTSTSDDLCFYNYPPEAKQWKGVDSLSPTKLKQEKSKHKILYFFSWNYNGVILKEPVPTDTTITKTYHVNKLHPEIKKRRRLA